MLQLAIAGIVGILIIAFLYLSFKEPDQQLQQRQQMQQNMQRGGITGGIMNALSCGKEKMKAALSVGDCDDNKKDLR